MRTDASCVPGKYELEKCGFLPNKSPKHCSFAKLICETDLQCNAKWEVFISECDSETSQGECSIKCRKHLNATLETQAGASLETCTCTDKEDNRCIQLRDTTLRACATADIPNKTIIKTTTDYVPDEPLLHPHTPAASDPFGHGGANPDSEENNPDSASTAWLHPLSFVASLLFLAFAKFCVLA